MSYTRTKYRTCWPFLAGKVVTIHLLLVMATAAYAQIQDGEEVQEKSSSRSGTGEVFSHREITLKPDVDPAEFEKWVIDYFNPALEGLIPGIRAYVAKSDRGIKKGKYAYMVLFDSYNTRQAYMPESGLTKFFREVFFEPNKYLHAELFEYIDSSTWSEFSDWVVLR